MELSSVNEVLCDIQRSMKKGILFDDELDKCRRIAEEKDTDCSYQHFILLVLDKARENVSHKRKREKGYIDLEDFDGVNDPQYTVNHKADEEELNRIDKGHSYQMPGRRYNGETRNLFRKHVDQARRREKEKVCSRAYLQKPGKGNNVIGEDGGVNRKTVVRSDKERLHQKPNLKNNRLTQYQNEHVDQARSVGKYKEQMGPKFKGMNKVKVELRENKKATVMADNENFQQGRMNNWVERSHCEHVDRQPVKKIVKRELLEVGQGKHGLSHQKAAIVNYSVKNEPDDGIKTRLCRKEVHNKTRGVKTALGKDVAHGQRELMKVGQGRHGFSHQKAVFENYSVKMEPVDGVKTRLHTKEVHNKIRSAKTAFGNDVVKGQTKLMKVGQGDSGLSHQQADFGNYSVKSEPDEGVKTRLSKEEIQSKSRSVKTNKCSVTYKRSSEMSKKGSFKILPEVEILDSTALCEGILSPFVPLNTCNDLHDPGCPPLDEFRKELLEVLYKPYDKNENKQHREAIRIGSFYKHYPDLRKKLAIYRYRPQKCLTILRGFFFWLQNVSREGSFKPWKDRQCLGIVPRSP